MANLVPSIAVTGTMDVQVLHGVGLGLLQNGGSSNVNGQFAVPIGGQLVVAGFVRVVVGLRGRSFLSGLAHAVAVAVGDDGVAVVEEAVEEADRGAVFGEEAAPVLEGPV